MLPGGDTSSGLVEAYVEVEGCITHKSSVVHLMFSGDPKSADRLRRVRGFSKHVGTVLLDGTSSADTLNVSDPICTLARKDGCIALTLGIVSALSQIRRHSHPSP